MTHIYIQAIKQPTLRYLTRSVRRRAATFKRAYRTRVRLGDITYAPRIIVLEPVYWSPWCCPEGMRQALLTALPSVMKAVAELSVYLARVVVMKPPERHTVVQEDAAIPHVERSHGNPKFLREAFPE